jgi:hypothetical protein
MIPIRQLISMGMGLAFSLTPDVQRHGIYRHHGQPSYDSVTGVVTPNDVDVPLDFILAPYDERDVDGVYVKMGDEKVVIRNDDLLMAGVVQPTTHDTVHEIGGQVRQIIGFKIDPTRQALILQCRQLNAQPGGEGSEVSE